MDKEARQRYEDTLHRYDDLFTPEWHQITEELKRLEKARTPALAAKRRILKLRRRLAALLAPVPCRCDCMGDFDCTCRRCFALLSNEDVTMRLEQRPARATPSPRRGRATATIPLPKGPAASGRSNAALAARLYLMVGYDGDELNTWIVNETGDDIEYTVRTGESGPGASGIPMMREPKVVPAHGTVLFDSDEWWAGDYGVWWEVFILRRGKLHHLRASRGWLPLPLRGEADHYEPIPYTDKRGLVRRFTWAKAPRERMSTSA